MMSSIAFVSLVLAGTLVQSSAVFLLSVVGLVFLVGHFCIKSRCIPEVCGAGIGFVAPAMLALHLIGELFVTPKPGEFLETDMNLILAMIVLVLFGSLGALIGTIVGALFAIVADLEL